MPKKKQKEFFSLNSSSPAKVSQKELLQMFWVLKLQLSELGPW